jgi:hypothetical protein
LVTEIIVTRDSLRFTLVSGLPAFFRHGEGVDKRSGTVFKRILQEMTTFLEFRSGRPRRRRKFGPRLAHRSGLPTISILAETSNSPETTANAAPLRQFNGGARADSESELSTWVKRLGRLYWLRAWYAI